MIIIDVKDTGKSPAIAVRGSFDWQHERELEAIGATRRSKSRKNFPDSETAEYRLKTHYEIPYPLIRRLFQENGVVRPAFMENYSNFIETDLVFEDTPQGNIERLRLRNFRVTESALSLYKQSEMFEYYLTKVKENDSYIIDLILKKMGITDDWFARKPLQHQRAGLAFFFLCNMYGINHICLFDEMRTGKTLQAIAIARYLLEKELIKAVLIIVPNSIKGVWSKELMIDCPIQGLFQNIIQGSKPEKKRLWESRAYFYIVNYESARADEDYMKAFARYLTDRGGYMLICDEAHKLKNPLSKQSQAILDLTPKYSLYMTGTPVANRPEDAWSMTNAVCPALLGGSIEEFHSKFSIRGGYSGREITGYTNLDEVRYRLARVSMRRLRKDIMFDQTIRQTREGELEGKQAKAYEEMRDLLWTELMNDKGEFTETKARNKLVQILRLQQITCGYVSPNPDTCVWFDENWKVRELDEFLEEYLDDIGKVVIWSRFVPVIQMLTRRYDKYGSLMIKGQMGQQAVDNMYAFQNEDRFKVMVAQIQTSEGKGFQPATFCIFVDKWWSPHLNKQAEDRIVGIKNPVSVTSIALVTKDTIDERIEFMLEQKTGWASSITGDIVDDINLPKIDKDTLLYLLAKPEEAERYKKSMIEKQRG